MVKKGRNFLRVENFYVYGSLIPICTFSAIKCSELSHPAYGSVNLTGTTPSSVATYTCNKGFQLYGEKIRTCSGTKGWTGTKPACRCELEGHNDSHACALFIILQCHR